MQKEPHFIGFNKILNNFMVLNVKIFEKNF